MSSLHILSFCLFAISFPNPAMAQDTIHWSPDTKLKWENFKGSPDINSKYKSVTAVSINYSVTHNRKRFSFKVACVFYKNRSWVKAGAGNNLLLHEQGHFDLTELYARKLRKAFKTYNFSDTASIEKDFDKIASAIRKERDKINRLYDVETNYSHNLKMQLYWRNKINKELGLMDLYK